MKSTLRFTEPPNSVIPKNEESAIDVVPKNIFGLTFKKTGEDERAVAAIRKIRPRRQGNGHRNET